jgi:hypothetical protein
MMIEVSDPVAGVYRQAVTNVAEPGPLIAMKLQSVMNRPTAKEGTDLLDIVRLTLDLATRATAVAQLRQLSPTIAGDVTSLVRHWFVNNRERSIRRIQAVTEGADIDDAALDVVTALLLDE